MITISLLEAEFLSYLQGLAPVGEDLFLGYYASKEDRYLVYATQHVKWVIEDVGITPVTMSNFMTRLKLKGILVNERPGSGVWQVAKRLEGGEIAISPRARGTTNPDRRRPWKVELAPEKVNRLRGGKSRKELRREIRARQMLDTLPKKKLIRYAGAEW